MIRGARQGTCSGLRRLLAFAMARDLTACLIPGPDIARAHGLDIEATGIKLVASPRHASILIVIGAIPTELRESAAIFYAQMARPRLLFALGTGQLAPLPPADIVAGLSPQELHEGVRKVRRAFAEGAFQPEAVAFDAPMLHVRIEYTCPMHPEVVQDEPGNCPRCGMTLVPREVQAGSHPAHPAYPDRSTSNDETGPLQEHPAHGQDGHDNAHRDHTVYTCPMHPEVVQDEPGNCPKCGMTLVPQDAAPSSHGHDEPHEALAETSVRYTCPMHPEVVQDEPGNCPKCGMTLVPREPHADPHAQSPPAAHGSMDHGGQPDHAHMGHDHTSHGHTGHDHGEAGFMSMIEVTRDLPRSGDGLPMDWMDVPFGPFFPGLPGGLLLTLTLDGDTVAGASTRSLVGDAALLQTDAIPARQLVEQLTSQNPLAPVAYGLLACRAVERAAGMEISTSSARARIGALERERIASHLNWLTLFAEQTGFDWLHRHATRLQLQCRHAEVAQLAALKPALHALTRRLQHTPLVKSRLHGLGTLTAESGSYGPVARASDLAEDARQSDPAYAALGFEILTRQAGDALARLRLRLAEILHSLALIEAAGCIERPSLADIGPATGSGEAVVETPRGRARLRLTLEQGQVTAARLETPSTRHRELVEAMVAQQALGDALVAVGSLDLSPWELPR